MLDIVPIVFENIRNNDKSADSVIYDRQDLHHNSGIWEYAHRKNTPQMENNRAGSGKVSPGFSPQAIFLFHCTKPG
jgi:hypothetical protein